MSSTSFGEMVIEVAREEMAQGAREIGGNNRGPFVERYLKPAGLSGPLPWCAAFVSWCVHEAARRLGVAPPMPYLVSAKGIFRYGKARGWVVQEPQKGDLVVWSRGAPSGPFGHAGIVEWVGDQEWRTIEGNRTPKVANFRYKKGDFFRLLGFIRLPAPTPPKPSARSEKRGSRRGRGD
jgi:hypothetical protein